MKQENQFPLDAVRLAGQMRACAGEILAAGRDAAEADGDRLRRDLAAVNRSALRMVAMSRHLALMERLNGADEVRLYPSPVDLAAMCRDLADRIGGVTPCAGVSFRFQTKLAALPTLADRQLLEQLVYLMVSNAVKALPDGGEVVMELEEKKGRAVLTLRDNGNGMAASVLSETPGDALLRPEAGLGLGLPAARAIAALHGGTFLMESREGAGFRAVFSLPLRESESNLLSSPPPRLDDCGGYDPTLVELSDCLPAEAFLPEVLE